MKTTTEKNEVLELLPINIASSKNFSSKCKMLIATLILLNGLDKVKSDGYFFRTNQMLAQEANMTEQNLIINLRKLESLNFLSRKAGKRGEASEYRINENEINSYIDDEKVKRYAIDKIHYCNSETSNNSNNSNSNNSNNSNKLDDILLRISNIENTLLNIQNTIDKIHYCNSITPNNSTDTETDIDTEKDIDKDIILNNNINYNIEKIKTELENTIDVLEKEKVEDTETFSNNEKETDSNLNNNTIEIKTNNDMDKQINENKAILIPTVIETITNPSENDFKAAGKTLYDNPKEDVSEAGNVGNNALKCVIPTDEENSTIEKDKNSIKTKIDKIMDLAGHLELGSLPTDDINKTIAFFKELENKAYTELTVYMFNDQLIQYGKDLINEAMSINEEFLNKFYSLVEAEEINYNVDKSDFKATGETLYDNPKEDVSEAVNVENNASECAISTNMDIEVNGNTIIKSVNNITIDNNNTVVESNNSNKINVETPTGFIQFLNQKYESNKINKEEYSREIDYLKRNYFNQYNTIKELILPMAV